MNVDEKETMNSKGKKREESWRLIAILKWVFFVLVFRCELSFVLHVNDDDKFGGVELKVDSYFGNEFSLF
jgi:hypothetical protein